VNEQQSDDNAPRAIIWDVAVGWMVGLVVASVGLTAVTSAAGWDPQAAATTGWQMGRAVRDLATGARDLAPPVPFVVKALFQLPFWGLLVGVPWLVTRAKGRSFKHDFGLAVEPQDAPIGIMVGIVCQLILVPLLYLPFSSLIDTSKVDDVAVELAAQTRGTVGVIALVLMVAVGAPIVEEVAFRGGIMRALNERAGPIFGLGVSSLLFGLSHGQLLQLPALVLIGAVAGALALRVDRIGPAIWAHVGFNATAAVALLA